jgi:hypothetical protein
VVPEALSVETGTVVSVHPLPPPASDPATTVVRPGRLLNVTPVSVQSSESTVRTTSGVVLWPAVRYTRNLSAVIVPAGRLNFKNEMRSGSLSARMDVAVP